MNWARVLEAARPIEGVVEASSQFSEIPALWVTGAEFAHIEREGWLSVRVGRKWARSPEAAGSIPYVERRNANSDWLLLSDEAGDAQLAAFLVQGAAFSRRDRHDGPPAPDEGQLVRRRRTHGG